MDERIFSNKYVIQEEIARGGMGVIYRALDLKLNRQVAIKVLHAHFSGDPAFAERFLREARAMARLDHENIIRIHAVEEQQGAYYIVMEYFPGTNLRTLIRERRRLSVRDALSMSCQVTEALAYAHSHGIIHRDIKPANVMVDRHGKTKLADFGIAAAADEASLTATGQIIGTPDYMSPEQAKGETLDGRSDLYSLGMLMYEMLVGATPYHSISKTAILGKLLYDREDVTLQFPLDVPAPLQRMISTLLRKEPQQRTADASTLATQLRDLLKTLPASPALAGTDPTVIVSPSGTGSIGVTKQTAKSVDLGETDILPPRKPVAVTSEETSFGRVLKTYHLVPGAIAALAIVLSLVGLTYYLSSMLTDTSPPPPSPPQTTNEVTSSGGSQPEPSQSVKEQPGTEKPGASDQEQIKQPEPFRPPESEKQPETARKTVPSKRPYKDLKKDKGPQRPSDRKIPSPPPPADQQTVTTLQKKKLQGVLDDFKTAYENRDISQLQVLSEMTQGRLTNLELIFGNYQTIKVSISEVVVTDKGVSATMTLDELVSNDGKQVMLDKMGRRIPLKIKKEGNGWGKILW